MKKFIEKIVAFCKKAAAWVAIDGFLHICVSALIVLALGWIRPLWIDPVIALAIGFGKEVLDKFFPENHSSDWHDIVCDLIGIALGMAIVGINLIPTL